jgi:hypothetical protein
MFVGACERSGYQPTRRCGFKEGDKFSFAFEDKDGVKNLTKLQKR